MPTVKLSPVQRKTAARIGFQYLAAVIHGRDPHRATDAMTLQLDTLRIGRRYGRLMARRDTQAFGQPVHRGCPND